MDAILMSLMTALNEHLLINVYQRDTDDFYTGYVQVLVTMRLFWELITIQGLRMAVL